MGSYTRTKNGEENTSLSMVAYKKASMNETEYTEVDLSKFRVGTRVTNKKYGEGKVTGIKEGKVTGIKEGKVMVSFNKAVKTFQFPHAIEIGSLVVKEW